MKYVVGMWIDGIAYYISSYSVSERGKEHTTVSDVNKAIVFPSIHYARAIAELFSMDVYVYSVEEN
jgi:hypothetical protein